MEVDLMEWDDETELEECPMSCRLSLSLAEEFMIVRPSKKRGHTHLYSVPFYFKAKKDPCIDPWLKYNRVLDLKLDLNPNLNTQVSFTLYGLRPTLWKTLKKGGVFDAAVLVAAALVYLLYPKNTLIRIFNEHESATQLNRLWKPLTVLANKRSPLEEAIKHIVELTKDTAKYSLVTEGDVAPMLDDYRSLLEAPRYRPLFKSVPHPFTPEGSTLYKDIKGVVDRMKFPTELEADEHTHLLMSILRKQVDTPWLLQLALTKTNCDEKTCKLLNTLLMPDCDESSEPDPVGVAFDSLLWELVTHVRGTMMFQVTNVEIPLRQFYHPDLSNFRVSVEVMDLIKVAEIRRSALGNRFICRNDFMWAFYEMGYGLHPSMIPDSLSYERHPPYYIYLACVKLAQLVGDKVRLENFIFAVLHMDYDALNQETEMQEAYIGFLKGIRNSTSEHSNDMEGPIFIRECSEIIGNTHLASSVNWL